MPNKTLVRRSSDGTFRKFRTNLASWCFVAGKVKQRKKLENLTLRFYVLILPLCLAKCCHILCYLFPNSIFLLLKYARYFCLICSRHALLFSSLAGFKFDFLYWFVHAIINVVSQVAISGSSPHPIISPFISPFK